MIFRSSRAEFFGEHHDRTHLSTIGEGFPRSDYEENERISQHDFAIISNFAASISGMVMNDVINTLQVVVTTCSQNYIVIIGLKKIYFRQSWQL